MPNEALEKWVMSRENVRNAKADAQTADTLASNAQNEAQKVLDNILYHYCDEGIVPSTECLKKIKVLPSNFSYVEHK